MKTLGFIAASCLVLGLAGTVSAEAYTHVEDPSGSAMCFDASGSKAALSACAITAGTESYVAIKDPTGVTMCFAKYGQKAPLAECEVKLTAAVETTTKPGSFMAMFSFFL